MWRFLFGAHAQVVVGAVCTLVGVLAWLYWSVIAPPTVRAVFHASMFFGIVACYAIIATGLGYRATERVEQVVVEQADEVDVDVNA
jgi:hypothetical protein